MKELIEEVLLFDDHRSSNKEKAISTTTLLGANWKANLDLLKIGQKKEVNPIYRRSSTLGSAFHMYAEKALADKEGIYQEEYNEKYIEGVWISGKFDLIYNNKIMDFKTIYGKAMSEEQLKKATLQMSIYRWLNQDKQIDDDAYVLFVSQSFNAYDSIQVTLLSIEDTERYIINRIREIKLNDKIDCKKNVKYNPCLYCDYDEAFCKKIERELAGGF